MGIITFIHANGTITCGSAVFTASAKTVGTSSVVRDSGEVSYTAKKPRIPSDEESWADRISCNMSSDIDCVSDSPLLLSS